MCPVSVNDFTFCLDLFPVAIIHRSHTVEVSDDVVLPWYRLSGAVDSVPLEI